MRRYESTLKPGTRVIMTAKSGSPIASGVVVEDNGRYVYLEGCVSLCNADVKPDAVADRRFYALEASEEPTSNQSDDAVDGETPETQAGDGQVGDVEPMAPLTPPKPKGSLSEDDVERLLMKVGETALTGLKSMGLKSGAIYPLMIKINAALKAALSTSNKD